MGELWDAGEGYVFTDEIGHPVHPDKFSFSPDSAPWSRGGRGHVTASINRIKLGARSVGLVRRTPQAGLSDSVARPRGAVLFRCVKNECCGYRRVIAEYALTPEFALHPETWDAWNRVGVLPFCRLIGQHPSAGCGDLIAQR